MMPMPDGTTISARQYLLGTLPEHEAHALEDGYVNHPETLERIAALEEELIEEFLDGRLNDSDRRAFEGFYLASAVHRNRVAVIAALRKRGSTVAPVARTAATVIVGPWFRHPIVRLATAAVLLFGLMTLMRLVSRPVHVSQVARVEPPAPTTTAPVTPPGTSPSPDAPPPSLLPPTPVLFAVTLPSLTTRGAGQPTVTIPPNIERVTIRLEGEPPGGTRPLTATIRTVDGRQVWSGAAARGSGGILAVLDVPAIVLPADDYLISVFDGAEVGTFAFRAARR